MADPPIMIRFAFDPELAETKVGVDVRVSGLLLPSVIVSVTVIVFKLTFPVLETTIVYVVDLQDLLIHLSYYR